MIQTTIISDSIISVTQNLLGICLTKASIYWKNSIKNHCITDWNNLKKDLTDILDFDNTLLKIKSYLKQKFFVQY